MARTSRRKLALGQNAPEDHAQDTADAQMRELGAIACELPVSIAPQLATLAACPPARGEWTYEIKFDGYRMLTRLDHGRVQLFTRNGFDWTQRLPGLAEAFTKLPVATAWFDGEAIVLGENGQPDFGALQNAFDSRKTANILYVGFDLMYLNGYDLRAVPLDVRQALLTTLLEDQPDPIRVSEIFDHDPQSLLASACSMRLEGIVGKRRQAGYRSGRSPEWIKLKCRLRQEFVVGGITRAKGASAGVRTLLLGLYGPKGILRYAGSVQPHLKGRALARMQAKIDTLAVQESPFLTPPKIERDRDVVWLRPELVAEASFAEWTRNNELRQASFVAFREDKDPRQVVLEQATGRK